jgi:hypothetical protein
MRLRLSPSYCDSSWCGRAPLGTPFAAPTFGPSLLPVRGLRGSAFRLLHRDDRGGTALLELADVENRDITSEGLLHQSSFKGLTKR